MHKSRLAAFIIDCSSGDLDEAARFWSAALGRAAIVPPSAADRYRDLASRASEPQLTVQCPVPHGSRIHLDIESDDVEAEVRRLEALGARRVAAVKTWIVMEAPTGQRFCVVRPQRGPLGDDANVWG